MVVEVEGAPLSLQQKVNLELGYTNRYEILQAIAEAYQIELRFDNLTKTIYVYPSGGYGTNRGMYFFENINLSEFSIDINSENFANKLIAYGKNGIKTEIVNNSYGKDKIITAIWKDDKYENVDVLRAAASKKLAEMAVPQITYTLTIADLHKLEPKTRNIFDYDLGDTVIVSAKGVKTQQRIVKLRRNEDTPERTEIELSTATAHLSSNLSTNNKLISDLYNNFSGGAGAALTIDEVNTISNEVLGG